MHKPIRRTRCTSLAQAGSSRHTNSSPWEGSHHLVLLHLPLTPGRWMALKFEDLYSQLWRVPDVSHLANPVDDHPVPKFSFLFVSLSTQSFGSFSWPFCDTSCFHGLLLCNIVEMIICLPKVECKYLRKLLWLIDFLHPQLYQQNALLEILNKHLLINNL